MQAEIAQSVVDPADGVQTGSFPQPISWPQHTANTCNEYLPSDSTINRFVWVVQYLARNGFYVIIDDHTEDATVNDKSKWVSTWSDIVTRISKDNVAAKRLIVDILNEPDARGWGWNTMTPLYLAVMDAIYPINPQVLFFVEGCGQTGLSANWGDGFNTNSVSGGGYMDPNPFFQAIMSKTYLNQIVISPHGKSTQKAQMPAA